MTLPYAETINYWMTSQTTPDTWMDKTKKLIRELGGVVHIEAFGSEPALGTSAFMLGFEIQDQSYKITWPVLPTRTRNERAARIQAATLMYHDVKARCLSATVQGVHVAFFSYVLLPDGRTAPQASFPELERGIPKLFSSTIAPALNEGEVVEGDYKFLDGKTK